MGSTETIRSGVRTVSGSEKLYRRWSRFYDWTRGPFRGCTPAAHRAFDRSLQPVDGARVLDLGCGTGFVSQRMRAKGLIPAELTLVDSVPQMLERARGCSEAMVVATQCLTVETYLQELEAEPVMAFDVVVSALLLAHLEQPERLARQLMSVVADGGAVSLLFFADDGWFGLRVAVRLFLRCLGARPVDVHSIERALKDGALGRGLTCDISEHRSLGRHLVCLVATPR